MFAQDDSAVLEHFLEWCRVAPCPILAPFFWRKDGMPQNLLYTNYENALKPRSIPAFNVRAEARTLQCTKLLAQGNRIWICWEQSVQVAENADFNAPCNRARL